MRYADRVKRDPTQSMVVRHEGGERGALQRPEPSDGTVVMTGRHKAILAVFGLAFLVMMYGVIPWEDMGIGLPTLWWWFPEMTALVHPVLGHHRSDRPDERGGADRRLRHRCPRPARGRPDHRDRPRHHRGDEQRRDHRHRPALGRAGGRGTSGRSAFAIVVFLLFLPLSFLIPSSSGLATVAMPIMAPLAAFVGVPRRAWS